MAKPCTSSLTRPPVFDATAVSDSARETDVGLTSSSSPSPTTAPNTTSFSSEATPATLELPPAAKRFDHGHNDKSCCGETDVAVYSASETGDETSWEMVRKGDTTLPKIEPGEEYDFCLEEVQAAPPDGEANSASQTTEEAPGKPRRGRPRKHSTASLPAVTGKVAKVRSKTGCITCRKRKKKCDETKPTCMNCEKNAVVCLGYKEKTVWKSGREKAEHAGPGDGHWSITLQPIFTGKESREDGVFWNYYRDHISHVFTVDFDTENAFDSIIVPLATSHQGMMHSVLSMASRHMDIGGDVVQKILERYTKITPQTLRERGDAHNEEAYRGLLSVMGRPNRYGPNHDLLHAQYSQMLFLVLESLAEGHREGCQRTHYDGFLKMLAHRPPKDTKFRSFITEVFYYHILADDLVFCPVQEKDRLVLSDGWASAVRIHPQRLIGVADGFFNCLARITSVRDRVRSRTGSGAQPTADYDCLYEAGDIETTIQDWQPEWHKGDSRERATLLYKQMAWLYLKTTINPPPTPPSPLALITAPSPYINYGAPTCGHVSVPTEACSTSASSPTLEGMNMMSENTSFSSLRRHSMSSPSLTAEPRPFLPKFVTFAELPETAIESTESTESIETDTNSTASPFQPPPPPGFMPHMTLAIDECLALIESFDANDPCQALLLVPCVLVGSACYLPADQERIKKAIRAVHQYTGLRNTALALELLSKVWQLQACGDYLAAWDWQSVALRLKIEHIF